MTSRVRRARVSLLGLVVVLAALVGIQQAAGAAGGVIDVWTQGELVAALNSLQAGDTVRIHPRSDGQPYVGGHTFVAHGSNASNLTTRIIGDDGVQVVTTAGNGQLGDNFGFHVRDSARVEISNIEFIGRGFGPRQAGEAVSNDMCLNTELSFGYGVLVVKSHHVTVRNNTVHGFATGGIAGSESTNMVIDGNTVYENSFWNACQGSGISIVSFKNMGQRNDLYDGRYANLIVNNISYRNENRVASNIPCCVGKVTDGNGIIVDYFNGSGYTLNTLVANNVVYENGGKGVQIFYSSGVDVFHNTLVNNLRPTGNYPQMPQSERYELSDQLSQGNRYANNLVVAAAGVRAHAHIDGNESLGGNVLISNPHSGVVPADRSGGSFDGFVDAQRADFRLRDGESLAKGAGVALPVTLADRAGQSRPSTNSDAGAYNAGAVATPNPAPSPPPATTPTTAPAPTTAPTPTTAPAPTTASTIAPTTPSSPKPAPSPTVGAELLWLGEPYDGGWIKYDNGTRRWITGSCRRVLLGAGINQTKVLWSALDGLPDVTHQVVSCDSLLSLLSGNEGPTPAPAPALDARLLWLGQPYDGGWVKYDNGTRRWISPGCRHLLLSAGVEQTVVPWSVLDGLPDVTNKAVSCDSLRQLLSR